MKILYKQDEVKTAKNKTVWILKKLEKLLKTTRRCLASAIIYTRVRDQNFLEGESKLTSKSALRSFKNLCFLNRQADSLICK